MLSVMALRVLLGTFLDEVSTILITLPVTHPIVIAARGLVSWLRALLRI